MNCNNKESVSLKLLQYRGHTGNVLCLVLYENYTVELIYLFRRFKVKGFHIIGTNYIHSEYWNTKHIEARIDVIILF